MLKRLIDFAGSDATHRSVKLTLQDIALCQLWNRVSTTPDNRIAGRVAAWTGHPEIPELGTAGRRHQNLLRTLITMVQADRHDSLTADEVAFLCVTSDLLDGVAGRESFTRVATLLEAPMRALAARRDAHPCTPGLATLERHVQYVTESDLAQAPPAPIQLLAGIEVPCRGPVYKASGHLRILGDVPDNCTVVVESDGDCCVDGYLLGRVLSRRHCEVRHNISGVAIVLAGHIRARGIINNALVVAKMGSVVCYNAQGPKLVFAGKSIDVLEHTMTGRFITRDMTVGGEVRGSHLEIAGEAVAGRFRHLGARTVAVVLRRDLSCADFGEVTGPELNQLLSRAHKLRRRARNFGHIAAAARHEADHTAQSVLMFIFGGGEVQKHLERFLRAQRRHRFICGVVDNLKSILAFAHDGAPDADEADDEFLGVEFAGEEGPGGEDEELKAAREHALHLKRSLYTRGLDRRQTTLLLAETRQKLDAMLGVRARFAEQVLQEERAIQHLEKYEQILAGSGREATKLDVLNKIFPALQNQPPDSIMGKRLRSSFVVRALRTVERATRHAAEFEEKAEENLKDFRAVSERLGRDFQIRMLENIEEEAAAARVTGRFESGVHIITDAFNEDPNEAPADAIVTTPDEDAVRTYVRAGGDTGFHSAS